MDGDARLRVTLLGAFRVSRGDTALVVPGARLRGLLVRLALAGGRAVESAVLIDAIWGEQPPADPAHALQALVSRLRRALGPAGGVAQVTGGYRLGVVDDDVDALRFERLVALGRDRLHAGDPAAAAAVLGEAVARWGDPVSIAAVAPAAATRLTHLAAEAGIALAGAELSLGRADAAAARLTGLLAEHPGSEQAAALLMDALAAQGREAEALATYERIREALAGTRPGSALRERHLRLLRGPEVPAPSGAETVTGPRGKLPAPVTGLIGRDDDLNRIATLLAGGRLVTVTGPGGAGKTRLAVEAAHRHRHEYRDGAWLIDLAPVTEPAKVATAVLAGIGLRGSAGLTTRPGADELDILADRECLLLVDNCEHLIDAVAHLVTALLSRCPGLRVLATSREPLAVGGEALVPLGPLALPGPDDDAGRAGRAPAVRLFAERAAAVRPGFEVGESTLPGILRVVRGLDGMPLALELAAARLRTLSLDDLVTGLSDRFRLLATGSRTALPRHRTLRAVIAWSWDLLGEHERTLAERVSILPGGVTAASATAVCAGTAVPAAEIPELLAGLVDRSILQLAAEPGRYRMLETLREFGIDQLAGDEAVRDLAADYFAGLVARHDPRLRGPGQLAAMRVIGAEYDNALAALRRRCDTGDATGAIALALDLTWYWQMFGRGSDAAHWLGEALAVPGGDPSPERDHAQAICLLNRGDTGAGVPAGLAGRVLAGADRPGPHAALTAIALAFLGGDQRLVDRLADSDDVWLSGLARMFRAEFAESAGELDRVRIDVEAALDCFRRAGDHWGQATALPLRAQLRQYDGDLDGALADLRRARSLAAEFGSRGLGDEIFVDLRWVDLHLRRGDTHQAVVVIDSTRERALRANSPAIRALVAAWEAGLRMRLGDPERARRLLDDADRRLHGETRFPGDHARALAGTVRATLCLRNGDLAGADAALQRAYAAAVQTRDLPIMSLVAVTSAALADAHGRPAKSAVLLGTAARLRGAHDRTDRQVGDLIHRGRAALGEEAFAAAYDRGWQLDSRTAATTADPAR